MEYSSADFVDSNEESYPIATALIGQKINCIRFAPYENVKIYLDNGACITINSIGFSGDIKVIVE